MNENMSFPRNSSEYTDTNEYEVFEGIRIVYTNIHNQTYRFSEKTEDNILVIDHCREGRLEQNTGKQYYYLSAGDMSIGRQISDNEIYFPTSNYHGISVLFNPDSSKKCLSCILGKDAPMPADILNKFCSEHEKFIIRSTQRIEHIFSELYTVPENIKYGYMKIKVMELLLFLSTVDPSENVMEKQSCTQSQVSLAKKICAYICENINTHITIEQLADIFGVSPTHLKKSFRNVYGSSVYAFVRSQKMLRAAALLRDTDRTVLDIAGECGYDNGSKFSKAFNAVMGTTPSIFRKNKQDMESLKFERINKFK